MTDHVIGKVLEARKTISGIFSASKDELFEIGLTELAVMAITKQKYNKSFVDNEISLAKQNDINIITIEDKLYPKNLRLINSPPVYLYTKGDATCLNNICIGVVGSRNCSKPAQDFTYEFAYKLAELGITIISGYAYGIDISSHRGAFAKGATACVLGSGLLDIYPQQHKKYVDDVLKQGCFVSEFHLNEPPLSTNFPIRNRIIAGLSNALAVIEAKKRSGSLITVKLAKEQGKPVYAVPTFPYSHHNACNALIKVGEASLLESYLDIVKDFEYELKLQVSGEDENEVEKPNFENDTERLVYEALLINELDIDELCVKLNVSIIELLSVLTSLEIGGVIVKTNSEKYTIYRR